MRVISGKARGKKLNSLDGITTRPTLDRVKESLFNIIQSKIEEANVLDLFAGSGALGIESLSRGAKTATFCDKSSDAIKIIKRNIEATKFTEQSTIINADYIFLLKKLAKQNQKFDIIFLDPPFAKNIATVAVENIINMDLLTEDGILIIETNDLKREEENLKNNKNVEIFDKRKYGSIWLIFVRKG